MGHYTKEAQNILDDFIESLQNNPQANSSFVEQLRLLIMEGDFTKRQAIDKIIASLEEAATDEP